MYVACSPDVYINSPYLIRQNGTLLCKSLLRFTTDGRWHLPVGVANLFATNDPFGAGNWVVID